MRESRIMSEIFTVMIETTISVTRKIAADRGDERQVSLVDVLLDDRQGGRVEVPGRGGGRDPGDDGEHFAGEAAHGRQQGGDHTIPMTTRSRTENGHEGQSLTRGS